MRVALRYNVSVFTYASEKVRRVGGDGDSWARATVLVRRRLQRPGSPAGQSNAKRRYYSVSHFAKIRLQSSAHFESGKFFVVPAGPSFCSGATYLVFIRTIETLRERGQLSLGYSTLERLIIRDQHDGEGVWGRWNANGPGTARLFHELGLGRNFDSFDRAKPGDFMKIFWSRQVGRNEHGHSTIFLGMENRPDGQYVRYWSSNVPSGYGEKSVPRSKIAYAIFSRLETPANLARIDGAPWVDAYLASLIRSRSSISEAGAKCGL